MFANKKWAGFFAMVAIASMLLSACATPTPQVIEKEVTREVEKVVTQVVKETVKETVIIEGTPKVVEKEVTKIVETIVEKVVTPTPVPTVPVQKWPGLKEGELAIALATEPDGLDQHICNYRNCGLIASLIADTLTVRDLAGGFAPHLATSWEVSPDGMSYTFELREDVKFHDGTPFNAEAVKANFERVVAPETQSTLAANYLGSFESAEVIDEYTVRISLSAPFAPFLGVVASSVRMLSPASFQEMSREELIWHPVGSGPFIFEEYVPNQRVVVVKNPDYNWPAATRKHQGPPRLNRVTFRFIPEPLTRTSALEAGEVQVAYEVPEESIPIFQAQPDRYWVKQQVLPGPGVHMVMNAGRAPIDDVNVRKALIYATDQETILKTVYLNQGTMAYDVVSPPTQCAVALGEEMYPYDPAQAAALLDDAGWTLNEQGLREKDGELLTIELYTLSIGKGVGIVESLQAQWKELGIDARPVILATAAVQIPTAQGGDFDVIWRSFGAADPNILSVLYHSKNIGPGKGWNFSHTTIPELDELLDEGDMVIDPEERCAVYAEAQRLIMENALVIPIRWRIAFLVGIHPVKELILDPTGSWSLWVYEAYVEE